MIPFLKKIQLFFYSKPSPFLTIKMILVFSLVGIALCFYGAMQMRNLKKQGFIFYLIGELLPILAFAIFIGFGSIFGGVAAIFGFLFAAVFIVLYATQRKNLVN